MSGYLLGLAIALDQFANAVLAGDPDETLSSRAWRAEQKGRLLGRVFRPLIDWIFSPLEKDHCRKSFESERDGRHLPNGYR